MIEVLANDRLGKKVRVKCNEDDLVGDLKKLIAAQIGTRPEKIRLQKWHTVFKDNITLADYEIHDGMNLEMYCACGRSHVRRARARAHGSAAAIYFARAHPFSFSHARPHPLPSLRADN